MTLLQNIIPSSYHFQPSWVMVLIVLSVMIVGYLFSAFNSRFVAVIKAFFSERFAEQLSREEHSLSHPSSVFLSLNFLLTSSLFVLLAIFSFDSSIVKFSFLAYLLVFGLMLAIYFIRIVSLKILGFIFDKPAVVNKYIFITYLVNQVVGMAFIPVIIFVAYGQPSFVNAFVYIGISLFVLEFLIRIGKGAAAVLSGGEVTLFYLLLYLCTLEILPLLFAWKLLEKIA